MTRIAIPAPVRLTTPAGGWRSEFTAHKLAGCPSWTSAAVQLTSYQDWHHPCRVAHEADEDQRDYPCAPFVDASLQLGCWRHRYIRTRLPRRYRFIARYGLLSKISTIVQNLLETWQPPSLAEVSLDLHASLRKQRELSLSVREVASSTTGLGLCCLVISTNPWRPRNLPLSLAHSTGPVLLSF